MVHLLINEDSTGKEDVALEEFPSLVSYTGGTVVSKENLHGFVMEYIQFLSRSSLETVR